MTKALAEITDIESSNVFIQLAFYKNSKETQELSFGKSKETLDKIREKISRGRSQYKSYLMD
ncbi:MAG: hypothetical protein PHE78_00845 [Candidatus Gastranaerophilales bacterium]|jgi:hypothetical protein|nr:hypothetical protein [Candidatus Gastranaerophilales bacterium]